MNRGVRYLAGLAAALLLFLCLRTPAFAEAGSGLIRVLLSEASQSNQMVLRIFGNYLVNGSLSFQRGARLKISCESGSLMLYYEGSVYRAGEEIRLRRYAAAEGEENGFRLEESLNLMEGDLGVSIRQGRLWPVLHIGIEDYLKGVVPYEMSDEFPLEALKAQAITARTYALRSLRSDRDFDVYDSTMDQVYKGYDPDKPLAMRAISETSGLCLVYGRQLAQCFYTASNGGQTESALNAWGRESIAYLIIKDDPYDLENPMSIRKSYKLPKQGDGIAEPVKSYLLAALAKEMEGLGYSGDADKVRIDEITGLQAVKPRYQEGSKLYTQLAFEMMVSGAKRTSSGTGAVKRLKEPVALQLPYYPELERLMALSINISENEVLEVTEEKGQFVVHSGRYGHGVGMSQRGAEWMAGQYGKSYRDILSFYYPGTSEKHYDTLAPALQPLHADFLTTPGPRPTATPRPTLIPQSMTPGKGQWIVHVTGVARNSSLNLREEPNLTSEVIHRLLYGQQLLVLSEEDGWLKVRADGIEGYVMASYTQRDP